MDEVVRHVTRSLLLDAHRLVLPGLLHDLGAGAMHRKATLPPLGPLRLHACHSDQTPAVILCCCIPSMLAREHNVYACWSRSATPHKE